MLCPYPSYNPRIRYFDGSLIPIPCNTCKVCKMNLQTYYSNRIYCAYKSHDVSAFVTFTYDDSHLPFNDGYINPTLRRLDSHRYIDKIKHQLNSISFEYFLCGEYGDKLGRPHYHALFFGLDYQAHEKFFQDSWKLGSVKVLPVTPQSFRYVTKYVSKNTYALESNYSDYGQEKPFFMFSRGLGVKQYLLHRDEIEQNGYFVLDSKKIYINRYYFNKLVGHTSYNIESLLARGSEARSEKAHDALRYGFRTPEAFEQANAITSCDSLVSSSINRTSKL